MPPVAAAVGAIGSTIAGAAGAAASVAGSALGGLAGLGASTLTTLADLTEPAKEIAGTALSLKKAFTKPEQTSVQTTARKDMPVTSGFVPTNILSTLPQILKKPQQQVLTTPAAKEPEKSNFMQYLPLIGLAVLGYFLLRR